MASLDLNVDYDNVKKKIEANKNYAELKNQYNDASKRVGDTLEISKDKVAERLQGFSDQTIRYQKQLKNQLEQLLDIDSNQKVC